MKLNKILLSLFVILGLWIPAFSQVVASQDIITNKDVIELIKAEISEEIILAKIKTSKSNFDTSSNALIELKKSGASEKLIIAILDSAKSTDSKPPDKIKDDLKLDISQAINKRKVYIDTSHEESELEIEKVLKRRGFEIVSSPSSAELYFKFEVADVSKVTVFRDAIERPEGKLTVYLMQNHTEYLIFAKKKELGFAGKLLEVQASDLTESFIKALIKAESSK